MKLHLGSGRRFLQGFTHVDLEKFPHVDYVGGIDNLSQFDDYSVDEIYCSHALEYFDRYMVGSVLKEWYRVLKKGAKLYVTVPDFDALVKVYGVTSDLQKVIGPLFGRWENSTETLYHRTVWNYVDLKNELESSGFSGVSKFDPVSYLAEIDPSFDDYSLAYFPHMDRSGIQISLALVALKS